MPDLWSALHAAIDAHQPDRLDPGDSSRCSDGYVSCGLS